MEGGGGWEADWHTVVVQGYNVGLSEESLSNPATKVMLPVPTLDRNLGSFPERFFLAMGRKNFSKLLKFTRELMEPVKLPKLLPEGSAILQETASLAQGLVERFAKFGGGRGYVIGTPGEGKSYLLAMLAGFLHYKDEWVVAYLSAAGLSYSVLRSSLKVALARDSAALAQMQTIPDEQLFQWLKSRPKMLFLVDDYNELDLQRGIHDVWKDAQFWKDSLRELSRSHTVVLCCSCQSSIRKELGRGPREHCLVLAGGFSKEELQAFEDNFARKRLEDEVKYRTGVNPRLLHLYIQGEDELNAELTGLRESLKKFMEDLSAFDRDEFVAQLAGAVVGQRLPKALDARCFYTGESGQLEAICDELKSVAFSICVEQAGDLERKKLEEHIDSYTKVLSRTNMVRTGWNAEVATLLALGGFPVTINLVGGDWIFRAEVIKTFSGGIKGVAEHLDVRRQVLHVPVEFNCKAMDCVMEGIMAGKRVVAGVQVSGNQDLQGSHDGAISEFCRVLQDATVTFDLLVFIWVGYFPENCPARILKVEQQDVVEVTMTFKDVHPALAPVDNVCAAIRKDQLKAPSAERKRCTQLNSS